MPTDHSDLFAEEFDDAATEAATAEVLGDDDNPDLEEEDESRVEFEPLESPRDFEWKAIPSKGQFAIKGEVTEGGFGTFELNLTRSLAQQLGPFFDSLEHVPLTADNLRNIYHGVEGVYALYLCDELSYVGKSNAKKGLKGRLERHLNKLSNRVGISPADVRFKATQIYSFAAIDVEDMLLRLARQRSFDERMRKFDRELAEWEAKKTAVDAEKPVKPKAAKKSKAEYSLQMEAFQSADDAWQIRKKQFRDENPRPPKPTFAGTKPPPLNNSGFGSNDTGDKRDTQKTSKFDRDYPLDLNSTVDAFGMAKALVERKVAGARMEPQRSDLATALQWFGRNVCFTFRIQGDDWKNTFADIAVDSAQLFDAAPMREVLARISEQLPPHWRISAMLGKVLVYREQKKEPSDVQMHFVGGSELKPDGKKEANEN